MHVKLLYRMLCTYCASLPIHYMNSLCTCSAQASLEWWKSLSVLYVRRSHLLVPSAYTPSPSGCGLAPHTRGYVSAPRDKTIRRMGRLRGCRKKGSGTSCCHSVNKKMGTTQLLLRLKALLLQRISTSEVLCSLQWMIYFRQARGLRR